VLHLEKQKQFEQKRGASWIVLLSCVFFFEEKDRASFSSNGEKKRHLIRSVA